MTSTTPLAVRVPCSLLLCVLASLAVACDPGEDSTSTQRQRPKSLLLVTIDTMRADHVGAYGYPIDMTPVLDELAERGVLFERAYAPMPQTLPSHATIMTGLMPRDHGALENSFVLNSRVETLAEVLGAKGYGTAAYIGALALAKDTGIAQGFDVFDQPINGVKQGLPGPAEREADETTERALAWADEADPEQPFFLWLHYFDPHMTHVAPRRFGREVSPLRVRDEVITPIFDGLDYGNPEKLKWRWHGYASEVHFTDVQLGRLLEGLQQRQLLDDTVVAVMGDHGEGLFQHRELGHGLYLWEEQLRVPFMVAHPDGEQAGTRVAEPVALHDVMKTLLSMTVGEQDAAAHGVGTDPGLDLWSLVKAGRAVPQRPIFLEQPHHSEAVLKPRMGGRYTPGILSAVMMSDHKLIRSGDGSLSLYDLQSDARETTDLVETQPEEARRLSLLLDRWLLDHDVGRDSGKPVLSAEREAALRALGYLGDG